VVSQGVSGFACLIYMYKKFDIIRPHWDERKFNLHHCSILCGVGVPMGLQYSITAVGSVILQSSVNVLGSDAVAACTAAGKVSQFFCTVFDALGTTMATYGGQNTGAGRIDRLGAGVRDSMILASAYSVAAFIVYLFFGKYLVMLFMDKSETAIIRSAWIFLLENGAFYVPLAVVNIVRFMIQGMGFSRFAVFSGVFEMIARSLMGIFMVPRFGFISAGLASPFAWLLADCFLIPAFVYCRRKLRKQYKEAQ
ncbi:MAG: MATE family efflux transporter, partial [Treponema sp.]|nr:MATE family efflux transporter [Treponema sp.]